MPWLTFPILSIFSQAFCCLDRIIMLFLGPFDLGRQWQEDSLTYFVQPMKKIGRVVGTQFCFCMTYQCLCFIAGNLDNVNRQIGYGTLHGFRPGFCVTLFGVTLQKDEIGDWLNCYQANFGVKGLIFTDRNLLFLHDRCQTSPFLSTKRSHLLFHDGYNFFVVLHTRKLQRSLARST